MQLTTAGIYRREQRYSERYDANQLPGAICWRCGNLAVASSGSATAVTLTGVAAGTLIPVALDQGSRDVDKHDCQDLIVALQ